jgi:hypothetical protein
MTGGPQKQLPTAAHCHQQLQQVVMLLPGATAAVLSCVQQPCGHVPC